MIQKRAHLILVVEGLQGGLGGAAPPPGRGGPSPPLGRGGVGLRLRVGPPEAKEVAALGAHRRGARGDLLLALARRGAYDSQGTFYNIIKITEHY